MKHDLAILAEAILPWLATVLQPLVLVELFASTCGLIGSLLLAMKGRIAPWGWVFFALSNIGWITFSYGYSHWFFLVQQIGFSITSAIGIWKWLIEPRLRPRPLRYLAKVEKTYGTDVSTTHHHMEHIKCK